MRQVREPVIIHWLGRFDPALAGYWGTADLDKAMDTAVAIINANAAKVDGVKVSLLDKQREIDMRRRLDNVKMYTGDDFNYALIAEQRQGLFARVARHLRRHCTGGGRCRGSRRGTRPASTTWADTVPLSRHIFQAPTRFYNSASCSWPGSTAIRTIFTMVGGQESTRSTLHLAELFPLADKAGLLSNPELATRRMRC